jgi:hypothetical protein
MLLIIFPECHCCTIFWTPYGCGTILIGKNPSRDIAEFSNGSSGKCYLDPGKQRGKFGLESRGQVN